MRENYLKLKFHTNRHFPFSLILLSFFSTSMAKWGKKRDSGKKRSNETGKRTLQSESAKESERRRDRGAEIERDGDGE